MLETQAAARRLIPAVEELRRSALTMENAFSGHLAEIAPEHQQSARNLLHYLALRQSDIRPLQHDLAALGLSSLGRLEAVTMATLDAVLTALHCLSGQPVLKNGDEEDHAPPPVDFQTGPRLLERHTQNLLGLPAGKRNVRVMVTMPAEAASDPSLVRNLLAAGMDVMRINCAHDNAAAWQAMVENCRLAQRELGRSCKIYADLAGPKLRTGEIAPAGRLRKLQPKRSIRGEVLKSAQCCILPDNGATAGEGVLLAPPAIFNQLRSGDLLRFKDTGGRKRTLTITEKAESGWMAVTNQTCYLESGLAFSLERDNEKIAVGNFGAMDEYVLPIRLQIGDELLLTRHPIAGEPARYDSRSRRLQPAHIHCTLDAAFGAVLPGERIFFDDGKIGGIIADTDTDVIHVTITQTPVDGARLRAEKGINLPDTVLNIPALTTKDIEDLRAIYAHVDMIGLSFVRTAQDVETLYGCIDELQAGHLGVVLKIENAAAFDNLPHILLAGLKRTNVGIMVARGDLAVEIGFERLAEVQEEILWLCEAAHAPMIWATQVLEGLAKNGQPSRAEVSDAVMSGRAECVMLNKGPYIVPTVQFLSGVLERMDAHQSKKRSMLRKLSISNLEPTSEPLTAVSQAS